MKYVFPDRNGIDTGERSARSILLAETPHHPLDREITRAIRSLLARARARVCTINNASRLSRLYYSAANPFGHKAKL